MTVSTSNFAFRNLSKQGFCAPVSYHSSNSGNFITRNVVKLEYYPIFLSAIHAWMRKKIISYYTSISRYLSFFFNLSDSLVVFLMPFIRNFVCLFETCFTSRNSTLLPFFLSVKTLCRKKFVTFRTFFHSGVVSCFIFIESYARPTTKMFCTSFSCVRSTKELLAAIETNNRDFKRFHRHIYILYHNAYNLQPSRGVGEQLLMEDWRVNYV
jgi:hypothetical protein